MSGVPYLAPTRTFVGAEGVENWENANFLIFTPNLVLLHLILFVLYTCMIFSTYLHGYIVFTFILV